MAKPFVHLHVHTHFSLLDGAARVADLIQRAKQHDQSAIAITDHGCVFGAIDFYTKAVRAGVKPILGIEAYMAPESRLKKHTTGLREGGYHLLLLAQNLQGYQNLMKLTSIAYLEGFYYKPRIDREVLAQHSDGLIATSACLSGEIPTALMADNRAKARQIAEFYLSLFGPERFFIELQRHVPEQDRVNPELMDLADQMGLGCVATNDVHFLSADDHDAHDVLCCISTGKLLSDESRMRYPKQLYLKSTEEMYAAMDHPKWAQACDNTHRIAATCNLELDFSANFAPVVKIVKESLNCEGRTVNQGATGTQSGKATAITAERMNQIPLGSTAWYENVCAQYQLLPFDQINDRQTSADQLNRYCDKALRELAMAGAIWRYGPDGVTDQVSSRLDHELKIIAVKKISAYFLIVWDFVNEARRRDIATNARGSAVGCMVGYCLGLSNACPMNYGLLFERFTDPDRNEYPDIDVDICQDGRPQIIEYVRRKYGHVAQIITFGSLKARAAIRDVGRVLNVPLPEVDQICKLVGDGLGTTIDVALAKEPDLKAMYENNAMHRQTIDVARRLEGLARHAGVHAAGVIIATQPLDNIVPLYRPPGTDQIVTQWDGPTCEKIGLLKMDFLGLRTLSIIQRCKELVVATMDISMQCRTVRGEFGAGPCPEAPREFDSHEMTTDQSFNPLDLDRLTFKDQNVLDLFRRGETAAVFQFESGGFRNLLMGMQPDRIEDLIAANALYRPGPMELIPEYVDRKHGRKTVPKLHPIVANFTGMTYGILTYQEQVMQLMHELGGVPLGKAYTIIKAISKKKKDVIDASRPLFIAGAQKAGMAEAEAVELFERILKFSGYGFNKSHSTGYSILAYQTAYLKTYFPVHYMAAVLTYESVNTDKVVEYIEECKHVMFPDGHRGIEVRPPDINMAQIGFAVVYDKHEPCDANHGHIRFGLNAVKGVGEKAVRAIISERENNDFGFRSLHDFCERVPQGIVNRATIEAMIKCGAFDSLHGSHQRAAMIAALDGLMLAGSRVQADREAGQLNFFETIAESAGGAAAAHAQASLPAVEPWPSHEQLSAEKQVLGFYVSSHPLDEHRQALRQFSSTSVDEVHQMTVDTRVVVGGMLTRARSTLVKQGRSKGEKMAMLTINDLTGSIDAVIFSDAFAIAAPLLKQEAIVFLVGRVDRRREEPTIVVERVVPLERAVEELTRAVKIVLEDKSQSRQGAVTRDGLDGHASLLDADRLGNLKALLRESNGDGSNAEVLLEVHQDECVVTLRLNDHRVRVDRDLPQRIATVLRCTNCCELIGPADGQC